VSTWWSPSSERGRSGASRASARALESVSRTFASRTRPRLSFVSARFAPLEALLVTVTGLLAGAWALRTVTPSPLEKAAQAPSSERSVSTGLSVERSKSSRPGGTPISRVPMPSVSPLPTLWRPHIGCSASLPRQSARSRRREQSSRSSPPCLETGWHFRQSWPKMSFSGASEPTGGVHRRVCRSCCQ
jgi:hypothetical protein